jgi:hypothetical protein
MRIPPKKEIKDTRTQKDTKRTQGPKKDTKRTQGPKKETKKDTKKGHRLV